MPLLQVHESFRLPELDMRDAFLLVVAGALVTHFIYKKYEVQPSSYSSTFLLLGLTPCLCSSFLIHHFSSLVTAYVLGFSTFYISLLASIACYRLSPWHPLAKYPGPVLAKLTKFWVVYRFYKGDYLPNIIAAHKKYGDVVRMGPNELSFVNADLVPQLLAPDMPKGPSWEGRRNPDLPASVVVTRSSKEHAQKRVFWSHAFSTTSVRDMQSTITRRVLQLTEELEKRAATKQTVNITEWMSFFAFDFMGDMAFGGSFELMRDGDTRGLWRMMDERVQSMAWQMHIPWATRMFLKLPSKVEAFRRFTIECALQRMKNGSSVKDLFYHLHNEANIVKRSLSLDELVVSGETAIVAGSDTTSTTLTGIWYFLLSHPECYERLQKEVDATFPPGEGDALDPVRLAEMKYLNAVINEGLRLQPAVSTFLHRAPEQGSGGKWIGGHFISEGTAVNVPPYLLHRDPRYFSPNPESFWPDRWLQDESTISYTSNSTGGKEGKEERREKIITDITAFVPFSAGNRNCVGKNLALAEMRAVIALLMQRFEMRFADGYDPSRFEEDVMDLFITKVGELPVRLTPRT
ncbi:hypothetical protein ACEPAG_2516 [Sanghuangporus baumii]